MTLGFSLGDNVVRWRSETGTTTLYVNTGESLGGETTPTSGVFQHVR